MNEKNTWNGILPKERYEELNTRAREINGTPSEKLLPGKYETAFHLLTECQVSMQTEISKENLDKRERSAKIMLIELCKDIALEFSEGVLPI